MQQAAGDHSLVTGTCHSGTGPAGDTPVPGDGQRAYIRESARLNMEFAKAGIPVKGLAVTNEELETYFLNLTGGNAHA